MYHAPPHKHGNMLHCTSNTKPLLQRGQHSGKLSFILVGLGFRQHHYDAIESIHGNTPSIYTLVLKTVGQRFLLSVFNLSPDKE